MSYIVKQLERDLWIIEDGMVRCFLLHGSRGTLLVDTGVSGGEEFADAVRSVNGSFPSNVILTHGDRDHIAGISDDIKPMLHPSEFSYYRMKQSLVGNRDNGLRAVRDGDVIACGERELEVMLIAGHTPGSIALLDRANRAIFIGDSVSTRYVFMFGVGRSVEAYIDSLSAIEKISDGFDKFYCSHGDIEVPIKQLSAQKLAAEKLLAGELEGVKSPIDVDGVKLYTFGSASFLY